MSTATLPILEAVDLLIEKARRTHDGIPQVTVVLGASGRKRNAMVHGHFAPNSWAEGDERVHEVLLSGESLERGAEATLGTILHELAHAFAHAQDIKDTSNNGRYHNTKFKKIAEEFGIHLEQAPTIGWSVTSVPDETVKLYEPQLEELRKALKTYRVGNAEETVKKTQKKYKMECPECGQAIVITKKWWTEREETGTIPYCEAHMSEYEMIEEEN